MMKEMKEFVRGLSETTTITKRELLLVTAVCGLGGLVLGMLCSPKKKVMIGSHNGCYNGISGVDEEMWDEEEEFPEEVISFK